MKRFSSILNRKSDDIEVHEWKRVSTFSRFASLAPNLILVFVLGYSSVHSQMPIDVKVQQPNITTLEEARYILAQMRRRNLDLKAKNVGDLDPNAIAGHQIDVLRQVFGVAAQFDAAVGANNELANLKNAEVLEDRDFFYF